jgi:hypothetical protein
MESEKEILQKKYRLFLPHLNEHTMRLWAAMEAFMLGRSGVSLLSQVTGLSRTTIYAGINELKTPLKEPIKKGEGIRKTGGGRKKIKNTDLNIINDLQSILDPLTRGHPESSLLWTCKSSAKLAVELNKMGHKVSQSTVYRLLNQLGYSLQSNRKTKEGKEHPDRDAQFMHIANEVKRFQDNLWPVISVDTKKKENIGNFKNQGVEWQEKGKPVQVNTHDFPDKELGKVAPYGVYDITRNEGWVSVGISKDTSQFAVESIRRWWNEMGRPIYPSATDLLITADCGGSNSYRTKLWKFELQKLADEIGLTIHVHHFPPGTSKWNKIEHRMFCQITENWRGRPLISREVVVNLIGSTKTSTGLKITASLDNTIYETGVGVSDEDLSNIAIENEDFHSEWNYRIKSRKKA